MIRLLYIEGISPNDQPTYYTLAEQQGYMNAHVVTTIESGFYPPLYRNAITLDTSDFDISSGKSINYLELVFNSKSYYYFIESIEYVNETLYQLNIVMDVIQTYMFNVKINTAHVIRSTIDRFTDTDTTINRQYIRENINAGSEMVYDKSQSFFEIPDYVIVSIHLPDSNHNTYAGNENYKLTTGKYCQVYPAPETLINKYKPSGGEVLHYSTEFELLHLSKVKYTRLGKEINTTFGAIYEHFLKDIRSSDVVAMYAIPAGMLGMSISCTVTPHTSDISEDIQYTIALGDKLYFSGAATSSYLNVNDFFAEETSTAITASELQGWSGYSSITSSLGIYYRPNKKINTPFSTMYCPVLLDNNYMSITFGDNSIQAQYPLEKAESIDLKATMTFDIFTGTYMYTIHTGDSYKANIYDTTVVSSSICEYELINDSYVTYNSTNKARYLGAIGGGIFTLAGAVGGSTDRNSGYVIKQYERNPETNRLITTAKTTMKYMSSKTNPALATAMDIGKYAVDFMTTEANHAMAPNTLKKTGNISSSGMFATNNIRIKYYTRRDIEQVAKYFETAGYAVSLYLSNIFLRQDSHNDEYVRRYYFNVLKCDDIMLDIFDFPEDQVTKTLIENRLRDGLRLWRTYSNEASTIVNTYGTMGQPNQYDNVELKYL